MSICWTCPAQGRLFCIGLFMYPANRAPSAGFSGELGRQHRRMVSMTEAIEFLRKHGGMIVFAAVLGEQIGFPVPAAPGLLAARALAGSERLSLWKSLTLAGIASLIGDLLWFYLGQRRGGAILGFLCKISLEPDTCVSKTRSTYTRYGPRSLLVAKFVPGLSTVAPPMAGRFG